MREWLIIGSVACKHWFEDARDPKDIDILTRASIKSDNSQLCFIDTQWHSAAEDILKANKHATFLDPNLLYTLKVSHAPWDIHWDKTMFDIQFLRKKGCELDKLLHTKLIKIWSDIHGKKNVNLAKTNYSFFSDAVNRQIDHDELHCLAAFNARPMHEKIRPDPLSPMCSEELFSLLSHDDKMKCALEEIIVVAIERYKLNINSKNSEIIGAFKNAMKQLITTMTTGWFNLFLIENSFEIFNQRRELWKTQIQSTTKNLQLKIR